MANDAETAKGRSCLDCPSGACGKATGVYPPFCATAQLSDARADALREEYAEGDVHGLMVAASDTASKAFDEGWCRVEEAMDFARRVGAEKIGVATCSGLLSEARTLARVLRANGFEAYGIACKVGALSKAELGVAPSACEIGGISCDPLLQARLLNEAGTQLNLVVGLCIGHDILFTSHSDAPCTTLIVKDRALVHNPAAALYALDGPSRFKRMLDGTQPYGAPLECCCGQGKA